MNEAEIKAKELVEKFYDLIYPGLNPAYDGHVELATKCAITHCDEMIEYFDNAGLWNHAAHFESVKQSIINQ